MPGTKRARLKTTIPTIKRKRLEKETAEQIASKRKESFSNLFTYNSAHGAYIVNLDALRKMKAKVILSSINNGTALFIYLSGDALAVSSNNALSVTKADTRDVVICAKRKKT